MIEITAWAPDRATAVAFMQALNIATVDDFDNIVPIAECLIHPQRPNETIAVVKVPAVMDPDNPMVILTPAVLADGWHWNMRFYGTSEATLRKPEPEGGWLPEHDLFDRTHVLALVEGRSGVIPEWTIAEPTPPGYQAGQCRAFDPSLIATRRNIWA